MLLLFNDMLVSFVPGLFRTVFFENKSYEL